MFLKLFFRKKDHNFLIEAINICIYTNTNILNILEKDDKVKAKIKSESSLILYHKILKSVKVGRSLHEALYLHKQINSMIFEESNNLLNKGLKYESYELLLKSLKKL